MFGDRDAFDEMSGSELLDTATLLAESERRIQTDQLKLAAHWAALNGEGTIDPERARLPGRPHLRFYGGQGTPQVASGAGAALGARLGRSTTFGDNQIADALDLQHRLPQHWARVERGEILASYARFVARRTRDLEPAEASYVDERCAESADGRITWSEFERLVEASIVAAAPAAAEAKEKVAAAATFARTTRSTEHGMRGFYLRTDVAGVAKVDATVAHIAQILADLGSTDPLDQRRATAAVLLASPADAVKLLAEYAAWRERPCDDLDPKKPDPQADHSSSRVISDALDLWQRHGDSRPDGSRPVIAWSRVLPRFTIYAHLYTGALRPIAGDAAALDRIDAPGLVRLEGVGPVTERWLACHLNLHPETTVRLAPVIDLEGQAPVGSWEIPERHRQAVRLMTPADVFPWGSASTNQPGGWRSMQIDHTVPWQPAGPGESRIGNYGPLTQRHHNLKTHEGWQVQQPFPGIYVWRDPHGALYLVDHTGTRRISTELELDLVSYDPAA